MWNYTLIRSSRRTLSLSIIKDGSLIVRAPLRYSEEKIKIFLHEKSSWIQKHQKRAEERIVQIKNDIWYYYLFWERYLRNAINDNDLKKIYKNALQEYIDVHLSRLLVGKVFSKPVANIRINSARTHWGSCNSKGNISFSYRVAMYSRATIDAVIIHEFAHLIHANHSKKFWDLVYNWMPDYEIRVSHLKKGSPSGEDF